MGHCVTSCSFLNRRFVGPLGSPLGSMAETRRGSFAVTPQPVAGGLVEQELPALGGTWWTTYGCATACASVVMRLLRLSLLTRTGGGSSRFSSFTVCVSLPTSA